MATALSDGCLLPVAKQRTEGQEKEGQKRGVAVVVAQERRGGRSLLMDCLVEHQVNRQQETELGQGASA